MAKKKAPAKTVQTPPPIMAEMRYCNTTQIHVTQEEAMLTFVSGNTPFPFAFSPGHLKRLATRLTQAVADYEKLLGKIDTHEKKATR